MKSISTMVGIAFFAMAATTAMAQGNPKAINTGGASGAYHGTFCPPIPQVLANAYFQGYVCTTSGGTIDNINRVLKNPTNLGFAQLDVYASEALNRPDDFSKLSIIRTDIAQEGLWMVTKNPDLTYGSVLGLSRRIKFVLPSKTSGSTASFNYLRSIDKSGLGRVEDSNVTYLNNASEVLKYIANSTQGEVGFFVQFADPRNPNIKFMVENKLRVLPVISREILNAKVGDQPVYQAYTFKLAEGGLWGIGGSTQMVTTAATSVALFTGNPSVFSTENGRDDAKDLIERVSQIPSKHLLPKDSVLASLISGANRLSQAAVDQAVAGVEAARKAIQN